MKKPLVSGTKPEANFLPSGDIQSCLETWLVVTTGKVLWPRILINILQYTWQHTSKNYPDQNVSSAQDDKTSFLLNACGKKIIMWHRRALRRCKLKKRKGKGYFCLQISERRMHVWMKSDWSYFSRILLNFREEARSISLP